MLPTKRSLLRARSIFCLKLFTKEQILLSVILISPKYLFGYRRNRRHSICKQGFQLVHPSGFHPLCHSIFPYQTLNSELPACSHLGKSGQIKRPCCLSIDCHMISNRRDRRGDHSRLSGLSHAAHHIIHGPSDILAYRSSDSHTCHHSRHIKASTITAATKVDIAGSVSPHLTQGFRPGHANLSLLFHLKCTDVSGLRLFVHGVLTFFTLDAETLHIILGLSFHPGCGNILGNGHQLTVAFTCFINFNRPHINAGNKDAESFLSTAL